MRTDLNKHVVAIPIVLVVISCFFSLASAGDLPREIEAVQKYVMETEYPELFGDQPYRVKLENAVIIDLDNDGQTEVVALFHPHYRQSPPIVIFQLSKSYKVTRVKEGLAPGELVPVSGDYLDSHTLGQAVDFDLQEKQNDPKARADMREITMKQMGSVVEYRTFFHADGRTGKGTYIDMTHIEKLPKDKTCESFEFSTVEDMAAGHLQSDKKRNYLVARVKNKLCVYRIDGFTDKGFLKKKLWVAPKPKDFKKFIPSAAGDIAYQDGKGQKRKFDFTAQ